MQVANFGGDVVLDLVYFLFSSFIIFSFLFHVRLQKLPLCSKLASISPDGLLQYIRFSVPVLQIALDDGPFLESAHRLLRSELLHSLIQHLIVEVLLLGETTQVFFAVEVVLLVDVLRQEGSVFSVIIGDRRVVLEIRCLEIIPNDWFPVAVLVPPDLQALLK